MSTRTQPTQRIAIESTTVVAIVRSSLCLLDKLLGQIILVGGNKKRSVYRTISRRISANEGGGGYIYLN